MEIKQQLELKKYTTLNIGGMAKIAYFPETKQEVIEVLKQTKPLILGNGSNVLIDDQQTFESVMILKSFRSIRLEEERIICDAGISLREVCLFALKHGLSGLEFAYGIPGSVGGAVVMNAGAYGGEIKDVVVSVEAFDQQLIKLEKEALNFSYRHSSFSESNACVLEVVFQLRKGDVQKIQEKMNDLMRQRLEKQPIDQHSAGSIFKRGTDFYASALINGCQLKGFQVGGAAVSTKHAGFLINENQATFQEFLDLIHEVQRIVLEKTGKQLEPEIKIIR